MRGVLRIAAWLLLSALALSLSSCAELALPTAQLVQPIAANSTLEGEGVIVNIAPTPSPVLSLTPTAVPTPLPTVTPLLPAEPAPTETSTLNVVASVSKQVTLTETVPSSVAAGAPAAQPLAVAKLNLSCAEATGRVEDGQFQSKIVGRRQHYFIYLPPCYGSDTEVRYPVVYLLHGIPMDERHWLDEGIVGAADKLMGSGEVPPFIIVMPHGDYSLYTDTSGGDRSFEGVFVNELLPAIDGRYQTLADAEHRAIGGISRGGVWSLEIAFTHPELFSAVGGHSPALSVNRAGSDFDPLVLAQTVPIEKLRIFLDAGDRDWTRTGASALSKVLSDRHLPHTYTIGSGDHDYPYWASQVEAYLRFYGAPWKAEKVVEQLLSAAEAPQSN